MPLSLPSRFRFLLPLVTLAATPWLSAQVAGPLNDSATAVARLLGPQSLAALVSISGSQGTPQPAAWEFTVSDPTTSNGLRVVRATPSGRAGEIPEAGEGYTRNVPLGFFRWSDVKVDPFSAFHAADQQARAAMVGFDSVHYLLRAREGSASPVWFLTLLDAGKRLVGRLEISASSGAVERRVWLRYTTSGRPALIRVEDSLSPHPAMQPAAMQPPPSAPAMPGIPSQPAPPPIPSANTPGSLAPVDPAGPTAPASPNIIPPPLPGTPDTIPAPPTGSPQSLRPGSLPAIPDNTPPTAPGYTPLPPEP